MLLYSKKVVHQTHIDNLVNSQRISKNFSVLRKICYKSITKSPTTPWTRRYTTSWNTNAV